MKNKRIAMLLLAAILTVSSWPGQGAVYAATTDQIVEDGQSKEDSAPEVEKEESTETKEVTEVEENEESSDRKTDEDAEPVKKEEKVVSQTEEIQPQAEDGIVVNTSNKTVTYNKDVSIEVKDINATGVNGRAAALQGGVDGAERNRNWKYIYNGKVHVTFDNCQLRTAEIIGGDWSSGWNIWIFNDTVDVTVKNCTIGNFVTTTFSGVTAAFGDEQYKSFTMNKKLTVNVQNSSITRFVGGLDKQRTYAMPKLPTKGIDAILEEGIDLNISGKSNITTLIGGNSFGTIAADDKRDESGTTQNYRIKGVNITANDSKIGEIISSYGYVDNPYRTKDLEIDGAFNVTLENGATAKAMLSNGAKFEGEEGAGVSGKVTGKTTFTTATAMSMTQMVNVDTLNLGASLEVRPEGGGTGAKLILPANGMEVNFVNENAWKNKDIALAYQYTTGTSPAIEKDKATFNWTNELLELRYSDQTDASTQQWQFFKAKAKIDYVTNTEDTVPSQIIPVGTKATKPNVTKKGYVFEGWYTTENFQTGTEWDFNKNVENDMTLYAKWKEEAVDIKISEKDGSKHYGTVTVNKETPITSDKIAALPVPVEKKGYTVEKWVTSDGQDWNIETDNVTANMEIHPVWKLNDPEVNLSAEGNVTKVHTGNSVKLIAEALNGAEGTINYQFKWYKDGEELKNSKSEVSTAAERKTNELTVNETGKYIVRVIASDDANRSSGEVESNAIDVEVTPHDFTGTWEKNEKEHWHVCTVGNCNVISDEAAHTYGEWTVEKEATKTEAGTKVRTCEVCGYQEKASIPVISDGTGKDDDQKDNKKDDNVNNGTGDTDKINDQKGMTSDTHTEIKNHKAAKTGDQTPLVLLILILAGSAGVLLTGTGILRKKR